MVFMMYFRVALALVIAVTPSFAAGKSRVLKHATIYDPNEVAWSKESGSATVAGTSVWQFRGRTVNCTGQTVSLIPRSSYADETMMATFGDLSHGSISLDKTVGYKDFDKRYFEDARIISCTADGSFTFSNLPAGTYYLVSTFQVQTHMIIMGLGDFGNRFGQMYMKRVELLPGQKMDVTLP